MEIQSGIVNRLCASFCDCKLFLNPKGDFGRWGVHNDALITETYLINHTGTNRLRKGHSEHTGDHGAHASAYLDYQVVQEAPEDCEDRRVYVVNYGKENIAWEKMVELMEDKGYEWNL